ncbi:MAG: hypothetical protein HY900_19605 [Deltaproteobacteria bacterium]|nr:hypothetical protein [Deltaproteobacteria bacterium]
MTRRRFYLVLAALFFALRLGACPAWAAVGCDLNDPEKDVARLFPGSTGFKAVTVEIQKIGDPKLLPRIEARLRDKLRGLYESVDVPYTIYVIYANDSKIGYIHGLNQKGRYGGIQIFLVLDLEQKIKNYYIQKMLGSYAAKFRDPDFEKQFVGLTLADFDKYEVATGQATGKVSEIKNPVPEADADFKYILRGTKKNLILTNEFLKASPDLAPRKPALAAGAAPKGVPPKETPPKEVPPK